MRKHIDELKPGDLIDLYGDQYADPTCDPLKAFEFEYAQAREIERETAECIVVHCDNFSCGFPPDHTVEVQEG